MEGLEKTKKMVSTPDGATAVAMDETVVGGLLVLLDNEKSDMKLKALEVISTLSEKPHNRKHIKVFQDNLMEQLRKLKSDSYVPIARLAHIVYDRLDNTSLDQAVSQKPLHDSSNNYHKPEKRKKRTSFFIGGVAKSKIIIFQVRGMHDKFDEDAVREVMLRVPGVVSFTCNFTTKRVTMRVRPDIRPEMLAAAIAKRTMTMIAVQVVKNDDGEEVLVQFGGHPATVNKENTELPDYPEEDEASPVRRGNNLARTNEKTEEGQTPRWMDQLGEFVWSFWS